ncbi:hypothetical protein BB559_006458 [Furculomyces boomerangus]|uniref:Uncharacterized protein n=1 Tax=Furculomyces boomerangus TaxID=61424 RepID=A0A2T9Y2T3_9FUNG|nr:hypothetical protein BB559_006458 [Furculomyces boomerangus]
MNSTTIIENDTTSLKTLDTTETLQDIKNSRQYAKVAGISKKAKKKKSHTDDEAKASLKATEIVGAIDTHDISLRSIRTSK